MYVLEGDNTLTYSSILKLNDYYINQPSIPIIKTEQIDSNDDGKVDSIILRICWNSNPLSIKNVKMLIFYDYKLTVFILFIILKVLENLIYEYNEYHWSEHSQRSLLY